MSLIYRSMKSAWRLAIPHEVGGYFFNGRSRISRVILALKAKLEGKATHDDIYDKTYYANYTDEMQVSAIGIVESIIKHFAPGTAIDIGCGSGEILSRFKELGINARGADLSVASLEYCQANGLEVSKIDLEDSRDVPQWDADIVISLEVAEHLPAAFSDHYVKTLISMASRAVIITAAPPGQGGTDHVNEQFPEYWIEKFMHFGANYSQRLTEIFRAEWASSAVEASRSRNVLVFLKNDIGLNG